MIVLDLELKGIYGFNDFHINFSYPKKIVNSIIDQEYLKGRERFRYKKAVILMGTNATGKTSLGKALLRIFGYMTDGNPTPLYEMVSGDKGYFSIDFVMVITACSGCQLRLMLLIRRLTFSIRPQTLIRWIRMKNV